MGKQLKLLLLLLVTLPIAGQVQADPGSPYSSFEECFYNQLETCGDVSTAQLLCIDILTPKPPRDGIDDFADIFAGLAKVVVAEIDSFGQ